MLSSKELQFLEYWEKNRDPENTFSRKLVAGLPMAIIFCTPILFLLAAVYFFLPDWYAKVSANTSSQTFVVVVIAVFIAVFFLAYFRMHFRWEMNEQLFKELKYKQKKENLKTQQTV